MMISGLHPTDGGLGAWFQPIGMLAIVVWFLADSLARLARGDIIAAVHIGLFASVIAIEDVALRHGGIGT